MAESRGAGSRGVADRIEVQLASFDGKATEALEAILLRLEYSPELGDELLELVSSEQIHLSIGSTWLLEALLEEGNRLDLKQAARLGRSLEAIDDDWARLHVCQSMRFLDVPSRNTGQFARFLDRCFETEHKFLRAWALDGWWRLARQHERYLGRALEVLARGEAEEVASVRARARQLRREIERY